MRKTESKIGAEVSTEIKISDVAKIEDNCRDASVYIFRPERTPLGVSEEHARLKLATDKGTIDVSINGEELDALIDSLYSIQRFHRED